LQVSAVVFVFSFFSFLSIFFIIFLNIKISTPSL
jgi:hypothetical protein